MRIVTPFQPPTLNQLMRGKLRNRMSLSGWWRAIVAAYWHGPIAAGKRRVTITIILGPRQRGADPDAYFKAVGDALVRCGALADDCKEYVEWAPVVYERGKERGCVIELEEIGPACPLEPAEGFCGLMGEVLGS